ncbi:MAG TPA: hypothetical protein VIM86_16285 [Thermodesulfobacteriota bacterium]
MKSLLFAAAALVTLQAAPAFAAAMDEVAMEKGTPVQVVSAPATQPGAGRIVNGEIDSTQAPARLDAVRLVSRPAPYDLNHGGGR